MIRQITDLLLIHSQIVLLYKHSPEEVYYMGHSYEFVCTYIMTFTLFSNVCLISHRTRTPFLRKTQLWFNFAKRDRSILHSNYLSVKIPIKVAFCKTQL